MPFQRFVETGRIAYISDGLYKGKLVAIVDVINQTRALVDGPCTGVPRQGIRLNQLHLTKFRIKFSHMSPTRVVRKAWIDGKVDKLWAASVWAKKVESKKKRLELTDFDRFKLNNARIVRNKMRTSAFNHLKRVAKKTESARRKAIAESKGSANKKGQKKTKDATKKDDQKSKPAAKKIEKKSAPPKTKAK